MESAKLRRDAISQPELWHLAMEIGNERLTIVLFPPTKSEPPIFETLPLTSENKEITASLEETIYDNPLLLSDFKKIDCLISSPKFIFSPLTGSDIEYSDLLDCVFPNSNTPIISDISFSNCKLVYDIDSELTAFLKRTFFGIKINHRLIPLITFFHSISQENKKYIWVNKTDRTADIAVFDEGRFRMANTFEVSSPTDMLYYISAVKQSFRQDSPKIYVRNISETEGFNELKEYLPDVYPLMLPDDILIQYKQDIPLTLLALRLCEL